MRTRCVRETSVSINIIIRLPKQQKRSGRYAHDVHKHDDDERIAHAESEDRGAHRPRAQPTRAARTQPDGNQQSIIDKML